MAAGSAVSLIISLMHAHRIMSSHLMHISVRTEHFCNDFLNVLFPVQGLSKEMEDLLDPNKGLCPCTILSVS